MKKQGNHDCSFRKFFGGKPPKKTSKEHVESVLMGMKRKISNAIKCAKTDHECWRFNLLVTRLKKALQTAELHGFELSENVKGEIENFLAKIT